MDVSPPAEPKSLTTLIQNLPQELFDKIFELVAAVQSDEVITITNQHRTPIALQISSVIRRENARIYYTTNKFTADTDVRHGEDRSSAAERCDAADTYMRKWLLSLPRDHRNMISEIRIPSWNETLATLEGVYTRDWQSLTLKETQAMVIREMNGDLNYWHFVLEDASLSTLNLKVDVKVGEKEMVWMNWDELDEFYYGLED